MGTRALLNLGHTFGHALEAVTSYQRWLHGEAVAAGCMDMGALKGETKASTGCGGCATLIKQGRDSELAGLGYEVTSDIC